MVQRSQDGQGGHTPGIMLCCCRRLLLEWRNDGYPTTDQQHTPHTHAHIHDTSNHIARALLRSRGCNVLHTQASNSLWGDDNDDMCLLQCHRLYEVRAGPGVARMLKKKSRER